VTLDPVVAYRVRGWGGVAFRVVEQTSEDDVVMRMVGDDENHHVDPADCTPLSDDAFCGSCGQTGCGH
jgi:hypothetical protein